MTKCISELIKFISNKLLFTYAGTMMSMFKIAYTCIKFFWGLKNLLCGFYINEQEDKVSYCMIHLHPSAQNVEQSTVRRGFPPATFVSVVKLKNLSLIHGWYPILVVRHVGRAWNQIVVTLVCYCVILVSILFEYNWIYKIVT